MQGRKDNLVLLQLISQSIGVIVTIAITRWILIIPACVLIVVVGVLRHVYIRTTRDIKRFEAISKLLVELVIVFLIVTIFSEKSRLLSRDHNSRWHSEHPRL